MVYIRYIIVNTQHKGVNKDGDDEDDDDNNNNNIFHISCINMLV